jgi:hypothetical protein
VFVVSGANADGGAEGHRVEQVLGLRPGELFFVVHEGNFVSDIVSRDGERRGAADHAGANNSDFHCS